jgi:hypothetical protein
MAHAAEKSPIRRESRPIRRQIPRWTNLYSEITLAKCALALHLGAVHAASEQSFRAIACRDGEIVTLSMPHSEPP